MKLSPGANTYVYLRKEAKTLFMVNLRALGEAARECISINLHTKAIKHLLKSLQLDPAENGIFYILTFTLWTSLMRPTEKCSGVANSREKLRCS